MVCKKNTSDLYWFGPKKCPTSSGGGESYIILHWSACSKGYKRVREGGAPRSQDVSGVCVCVCSPLMSRMAYRFIFLSPLKWSWPSPFIDARGTLGYMHVLRDIFPRKEDPRPSLLPCSWWRATIGGATPVLWCCSDMPWHTWFCGCRSYKA
jgi:hypothetical protein